jgi:hypothetical protein
MPTEADVRAAIKAKVEGVANIGTVHDYERYAKNLAEFRALYEAAIGGNDQVRGWHIRRMTRRESSPHEGRWIVILGWRVQGYMSFEDAAASEKTFDNLVEDLVDAFRADETLGDVVDSTIVGGDAGLQVEDSGPVMFGGVLCHSARCRLMTRHYV